MSEIFDVVVIGGGAAGMMAAGQAALRGKKTLLLERNPVLGKKLAITGKGRCNLTNDATIEQFMPQVAVNGRFLYSALNTHGPRDTMDFFESIGVQLKTERGRRVFPQSDRSADAIQALQQWLIDCGVTIRQGRVSKIATENGQVSAVTYDNTTIPCQAIVLATGGLSYPKTGSTGDGYTLAKACGHSVTPLRASLVPLEAGGCADMQGLSLRNVTLTATDDTGAKLFCDMGELLFTHFGLSGPLILSASAHLRDWTNRTYTLHINMKPALSPEELDARILRDIQINKNKYLRNILALLLHASCIPPILRRLGYDGRQEANAITKEQRKAIAALVQDFTFHPTAPRPIDEAVITSGGVKVSEVNPKTMESKLCQGLYIVGELLDVDAYTGGYNLQIAWSTGYVAGSSC